MSTMRRVKDSSVVIAAAGRDMAAPHEDRRQGRTTTRRWPAARPAATGVKIEAWCATLHEAGIPAAPVRTIPEVAKDPHLWEREMLVKMVHAVAGEMYLPGATVKLSKTPARVGPVPTVGQHTDEMLGGLLGYERAALEALRSAGVIA